MKWLFRWWRQIVDWFQPDPAYQVRHIQGNLPGKLNSKTMYLVGEDGFLEHVSMLCPCGCRQIVHLNLLTDERPVWQLVRHQNGKITLHPSIWRKVGCRSHYWIRENRIQWCKSELSFDRTI